MTLCLVLGVSIAASNHTDTANLIGLLSLWPRKNVLVFRDQLAQFDSDSIHEIVGWSKHFVVAKDALGKTVTIDVRRIERKTSNLWSDRVHVTDANQAIVRGPASEALFTNSSHMEPSPIRSFGIGTQTDASRFYMIDWSESDNRIRLRSQLAKSELVLKGYSVPVLVDSPRRLLVIEEGNAHFGALVAVIGAQRRPIFKNAQTFLVLSTRTSMRTGQ